MDLLHPEDRPAVLAAVERHLSGRADYDLEYRMRNKSGEYRWYRAGGQAIWDAQGRPVRMAGSLKDIHGRKLDQIRLVESNNRYETAILASGQVVYEWDTATDETKWSGDLEGMLGQPVAGLTGELWLARVHPDDLESVSMAVGSFLTSKGSLRLEYRLFMDRPKRSPERAGMTNEENALDNEFEVRSGAGGKTEAIGLGE